MNCNMKIMLTKLLICFCISKAWANNNDATTPTTSPVQKNFHDDRLIVETKSGLVKGYAERVMGREVHIFTGIPFAKPPLGPLRFRKPVPIEPWHGVLEATAMPNSCYQMQPKHFPDFESKKMWAPNTNISEDCLYLNIWVPQHLRVPHRQDKSLTERPKVPILVWIYGGLYMSGTSTLDAYKADIMASSSDVIVASMQYRVGAFGFLYLNKYFPQDSEEAPGNMGLWDQRLAIRWIKDNAKAFGGDPELITLFGESSGSSSVSLHMLSPEMKGLFKRAILQSGTLNAPCGWLTEKYGQVNSEALVNEVHCKGSLLKTHPSSVMDCMRGVDSKTISVYQWITYTGLQCFAFAPTVDGIFLPKDPDTMMKEGNFHNTEVLLGSDQNVGLYYLLFEFINYLKNEGPSSFHRDKFLQVMNLMFYTFSKFEIEAIVFQYTDWQKSIDVDMLHKMIAELVRDYFYVCPMNYFAEKLADSGVDVYYYYFTQWTRTSIWGEWIGPWDGGEIQYVFGRPLNMSLEYDTRERELSSHIMQSFTRFALTGKPHAPEEKWPLYSRSAPHYYTFTANGTSGPAGPRGPRASACAFWNDFFKKLNGIYDIYLFNSSVPRVMEHKLVLRAVSLVPETTLYFSSPLNYNNVPHNTGLGDDFVK